MLQDLFPRDHKKFEESCFGAELEAFASWLAAEGHMRHPLRLHLHRARTVLEGCGRFQPGGTFPEEDLRQAFVVPGPSAYMYQCTGRIFARFLAAANRLVIVERTDALSLLRQRYHQHLAEVRGFSAQSLKQHGATVVDFLSRGLTPGRGISGLTTADIDAFVQLKSLENSRQSLQHVIAHLRAFLRYCADHGEAPAGLDIIDTPRVYRGELPPRALDWTTVRRLLASIRRRSPRDWRDYVVLHLMAHYGLRPCEVAALRLDAVDWEGGTLKVDQRKTRSTLVLPLAAQTLGLLRRYLEVGRGDSNLPQLFLRIRSPIRAMNHHGIIEIFTYRAAQSGLPLEGVSSYSLRHGFAMRLLRRGVGIKAIGDLLGHRSLEATCAYLRIDIDMLRTVGLPVPTAASIEGGDHG